MDFFKNSTNDVKKLGSVSFLSFLIYLKKKKAYESQ